VRCVAVAVAVERVAGQWTSSTRAAVRTWPHRRRQDAPIAGRSPLAGTREQTYGAIDGGG
jgi:hypothetical protein